MFDFFTSKTCTIHGFTVHNVPNSALSYHWMITVVLDYTEYWYYGADNDRDHANEVALDLRAEGRDVLVLPID